MLNVILKANIDSKTQHLYLFFFSCWAENSWANGEGNSASLRGGGDSVSPPLICLAPTCSVAAPSIEIWFFLQLCPSALKYLLSQPSPRIIFQTETPGLGFIAGSRSVGFKPRIDSLNNEICPIRNCYTHTFAHLKTSVKTPQAQLFCVCIWVTQ